jgi:hypothetical protein
MQAREGARERSEGVGAERGRVGGSICRSGGRP